MAISKVIHKNSLSDTPVTWMDATSSTATAADIASSKTAMLANGVMTTGIREGTASNIVTGTFTGTTAGATMDVTIPYTGNGYPIAGFICPTNGTNKPGDPYASVIQKYSTVTFSFVKQDIGTAPDYTSSSAEENKYSEVVCYQFSDSDHTSTTSGRSYASILVNRFNATETYASCVRFKGKTTMSVFIANTSYGFVNNIEYSYQIIYSS